MAAARVREKGAELLVDTVIGVTVAPPQENVHVLLRCERAVMLLLALFSPPLLLLLPCAPAQLLPGQNELRRPCQQVNKLERFKQCHLARLTLQLGLLLLSQRPHPLCSQPAGVHDQCPDIQDE